MPDIKIDIPLIDGSKSPEILMEGQEPGYISLNGKWVENEPWNRRKAAHAALVSIAHSLGQATTALAFTTEAAVTQINSADTVQDRFPAALRAAEDAPGHILASLNAFRVLHELVQDCMPMFQRSEFSHDEMMDLRISARNAKEYLLEIHVYLAQAESASLTAQRLVNSYQDIILKEV